MYIILFRFFPDTQELLLQQELRLAQEEQEKKEKANEGKVMVLWVVFLDISKALDTAKHCYILQHLRHVS